MKIGILVVCDSNVDVSAVMSMARALLAHKKQITFVRAICLHPLGAQYWNALAANPMFSEWVEPAILIPSVVIAEALRSCSVEDDDIATIVMPLVAIGHDEVLQAGLQMRPGIDYLTAQFPVIDSTDGKVSVNIHIFAGEQGLNGLDIPQVSNSIELMDCLANAVLERQSRLRYSLDDSQLAHSVYAHGGSSLSPGMETELTVIVPTLDASSKRFNCLYKSLYDSTDVPFQLVIVDNGKSPQGYSGPVNAGIKACTTRYAVIINDDVVLTPGWWPPLRRALESGSWVVFPVTKNFTREDFSAWCFAIDLLHFAEYAHGETDLFDPQLRIWFQDSDLYLKLLELGNPPKLVEQSHISHELSATVNTHDTILSQWIDSVISDDKMRFVERWGAQGLEKIGFVCNETRQLK